MCIKEINIENFKCFKGKFNLKLNEGLNVLVGDNESGKLTILEAVHLVLSGLFARRYLRNELAPTSRSKLHVAITRAKLSVAFVTDEAIDTHGIRRWENVDSKVIVTV
jgi:predicted ATP-dependent endonuclease of OLD family